MAVSIVNERERGTFPRNPHPHNGDYAGDFGAAPSHEPSVQALAARWAITSTIR